MPPISELLKEWQRVHGFSDQKLAAAVGISDQVLLKMRSGHAVFPCTAELLSDFTGIPVKLFKLYTNKDRSHPWSTSQAFVRWSALDGLQALCAELRISCEAAFIAGPNITKIKEKLKKISEDQWNS